MPGSPLLTLLSSTEQDKALIQTSRLYGAEKRRKRQEKLPFLDLPQHSAERQRTLAAAGEPVGTVENPWENEGTPRFSSEPSCRP